MDTKAMTGAVEKHCRKCTMTFAVRETTRDRASACPECGLVFYNRGCPGKKIRIWISPDDNTEQLNDGAY